MEFVGKGKKQATNSMHSNGNAIDIVINDVKTINLKFPKLYKHVGTRFGTSLNAEVFSRCGIMSQGAGCLKKKILQNSSIKLEKRLAILSAYIFTKGTFQCSTWSDLSPTAAKKFHGAIMSLYRYTIGMYHGNKQGIQNINDEDILYLHNVTNPYTMIRVARLSLWSRILCKAPKIVIDLCMDLAAIQVGWPAAVMADLKWISSSEKCAHLAEATFEDWAAEIKGNRKGFIGNIKKFSKLRYANTLIPPIEPNGGGPPSSSEQPLTFNCTLCNFESDTCQKLAIHKFKVHKVKSVWGNYLGDHVHCPICLKHFHTRERVLNHVRYRSEICRHNLVLRNRMWTDAEVSEFDADDAESLTSTQASGKRRHHAEAPVIRLVGPLLPILLQGNESNHHPLGVGHRYT